MAGWLGCTLAIGAAAQGSPHPSPETSSAAATEAPFVALQTAEQQAVQSGDPNAIAEACKQLNAAALRGLGRLRTVQGQLKEAVALFEESLAVDDSSEARLEFVSALLRAGDGAAAAQQSESLIQTAPGSAAAWAVRGNALRMTHHEVDGVEAFRHSLALRSDMSVAYALASTLLTLQQKAKAEVVFQQILRTSDKDTLWHIAIGDAYRQAGYPEDAVAAFQTALASDPHVAHGELFLGYTYLQMNHWEPNPRSLEHLRTAIRQSPQDFASNFYLGAAESIGGSDLSTSDRHLHAAAEADPSQPEVWLYLGLNANREHNLPGAKQFLQKAIDQTGSDEARNNYQVRRAYFALGHILIAEGDHAHGDALLAKYQHAGQAAAAQPDAGVEQRNAPQTEALNALPQPAPPAVAETGESDSSPASQVFGSPPSAAALPEGERRRLQAREEELRRMLAEGYNDLGTAEARQQQYPAALASFSEAEHWQSPDPTLLRNIGVAAFRVQDFQRAVTSLTAYLQHKDDSRLRVMLAMSQFSMGAFPQAAASFAQAPEQTSADPRAAYAWAFSLARTGQQQHANQIAAQLTSLQLPPDALNLVCHVFMDTEAYEQSLACLQKVAAADPTMRLVHYGEGESLIRLDRPAEAIPELRTELKLTPGDPNVESSLAFALLQTSQKDEAKAILEQAVTADPNHARAQYQLGKLLLDGGDAAAAVPHLQTAERVDPSPDYVHYQLGTAYRKLGRAEDAERELRTYREIKDKARAAAAVPDH